VIAKYAIIAVFAISILAAISAIGKPRRPLTSADAILLTVANTLWIVLILVFWK
jgi:hypothetical protein